MGFIESIKECFGQAGLTEEPTFKAVLFGDGALYLQGVRSIKSYSAEKVEITLKKGGLTILGEGMFVKKYCAGDLAICGKILSLKKD